MGIKSFLHYFHFMGLPIVLQNALTKRIEIQPHATMDKSCPTRSSRVAYVRIPRSIGIRKYRRTKYFQSM